MAIASLVLGILGILFSLLPLMFWVGVPLAFLGLILGIVGRKSAVSNNQPTATATAGLVLSVIGLCIGLTITIWCASCIKRAENDPHFPRNLDHKQFNEAFKKALEETTKNRPSQPPSPTPAEPAPTPAPKP